jgi:pre-mRNA-splicing factor 18
MDFAAQMEALLGKAKSRDQTSAVKRGDLLAKQDEEYYAQQQKEEEARESRRAEKRQREEEWEAREERRKEKMRKLADEVRIKREQQTQQAERMRRKRLGLPPLPEKDRSQSGTPAPEGEDIEDAELVEKLRGMGHPATLFGESHEQRLRRYRRLTNIAKVYKGPIDTTLEPVPEIEMKIPPKPPKDPKDRKFLYRQLASFFTLVLREWQLAMDKRSPEVKNSSTGRQAESVMKQAREFLTPFYRMLEKESLDDELLNPIVEIVFEAQEKRYVKANDAYLRLSIGKAAWPIGVTMVGIHARSAREKLHESETAHIMSDETTRKMLQSIKRCLTFAQTRWPPDDHLQLMG